MNGENTNTVFVAGASGVVGRRLCRLLVEDGFRVLGSTRKMERAQVLRELGVEPIVVDAYDADGLLRALRQCRPRIVVHQLTDLPADQARVPEAAAANSRLREVGTLNLVRAAVQSGAQRLVAQSIAFAYAPGEPPHAEDAPLNVAAPDERSRISARGVASLEAQVLAAPLTGLVLRYGRLYGDGTWFNERPPAPALHADAAADAARRAIRRGPRGIYNIAENDGSVLIDKAVREFGFDPSFRDAAFGA